MTRARLRLRGFTAATFRRRRLELRRLRRGFTAAKAVFRRRDRRRVALRLRLFATLTLLVLYLIFVTTLTRLRLLRRGAVRVFLRRRELLRFAFRTFSNRPLLSLGRFFSELRRRLRAFAIVPPEFPRLSQDFFFLFFAALRTLFRVAVEYPNPSYQTSRAFLFPGLVFPSSVKKVFFARGFPPIKARCGLPMRRPDFFFFLAFFLL